MSQHEYTPLSNWFWYVLGMAILMTIASVFVGCDLITPDCFFEPF